MANQQYSSDPFAPNYRYICTWSAEEKADYIASWPVPTRPDFWEVYESAEHAEYCRDIDQLMVLLRERGLEEAHNKILFEGLDGDYMGKEVMEERYERIRALLRDAGELGLLERREKIWRVQGERGVVVHRENPLEHLLEIEDEAG